MNVISKRWQTYPSKEFGPQNAVSLSLPFLLPSLTSLKLANANEMVLGLGDFNDHVGKCAEGFEGIHGGYVIGKRNVKGRMLLDFCVQKEVCVANT